MNMKLTYSAIVLMSVATAGILFSVVLEIITNEPVYLIMVKVAALLFGVGGGLMGIASLTRRK